MKSDSSRLSWLKEWLLLGVLLVAEFAWLRYLGIRQAASSAPLSASWLAEAYGHAGVLHQQGLWGALREAVLSPSAQGSLASVWALLAFAIGGPTREAALSANLVLFLIWQLSLFVVLRSVFSSRALAWGGLALLLSLKGLWDLSPGSALDFSPGWMSLVWLGLCGSAAYSSANFTRLTGALLFGVCMGLAIGTHFALGMTLLLVNGLLAVWLMFKVKKLGSLHRLALSWLVAFLIAGPLLWVSREQVVAYYYQHYIGPGSVERGVDFDFFENFDWLMARLGTHHLGLVFGCIAGLGTFCYAITHLASAPMEKPEDKPALSIALSFVIAPLLVLIATPVRSEIGAGLLLPGLLFLLLHLWRPLLAGRVQSLAMKVSGVFILAAFMSLGVRTWLAKPSVEKTDDQVLARELAKTIAHCPAVAEAAKAERALRLAVDQESPLFRAETLQVLAFEAEGSWLRIDNSLPVNAAFHPKAEIQARLHDSDFVLLTKESSAEPQAGFEQQMQRERKANLEQAARELQHLNDYRFASRTLSLFTQKEPTLEAK